MKMMKVAMLRWCVLVLVHITLPAGTWAQQFSALCMDVCSCERRPSGVEVRCHGGGLREIPYPSLKARVLDISPPADNPNYLQGLPKGAFMDYENLQELRVVNSNVSAMEERAFVGLTELKVLDLSWNIIKHISTEHWLGLDQLQVLNLKHNNLSLVISGVFFPLQKLRHLDLSHNDLTSLAPRLFQNLAELRTLILNNNPLHYVEPNIFQDMPRLSQLLMNNCSLHKISNEMFEFMPTVTHLELNSNKLDLIDRRSFQTYLPSLRTLHLEDNNLRKLIPGTFSNLTLKHLSLARNYLSIANTDAFVGNDIRGLSLAQNNLPDGKLKLIIPISNSLTYLDLSGNRRLHLDQHYDELKRLVHLEEIVVRNMGYVSFNFNDLNMLGKLARVDVSFNDLEDLVYVGALMKLKHMSHLNISHNHLTRLSQGVVDVISQLDHVSLQGNPWACDCHIKPVRDWLAKGSQFYGACQVHWNATCLHCSSPLQLNYSEIWKLRDAEITLCPELAVAALQMPTKIGISVGIVIILILVVVVVILGWRYRTIDYYTKEEKRKDSTVKDGDVGWCNHSNIEADVLLAKEKPEITEDKPPAPQNGGNHMIPVEMNQNHHHHVHFLPPQHTVNNVDANHSPYHPHHFNHHYHPPSERTSTPTPPPTTRTQPTSRIKPDIPPKPQPPPKPARIVIEETDF